MKIKQDHDFEMQYDVYSMDRSIDYKKYPVILNNGRMSTKAEADAMNMENLIRNVTKDPIIGEQ